MPIVEMDPIQTSLPITDIEFLAQTEIPKTAFDIQSHVRFNSAIYIKFRLPASELDKFLFDAGFKSLETGYWPFGDYPIEWWPNSNNFEDKPEDTYAGENLALVGFGKIIGVDMKDKNIFIIYLLCFRT